MITQYLLYIGKVFRHKLLRMAYFQDFVVTFDKNAFYVVKFQNYIYKIIEALKICVTAALSPLLFWR